MIKKTLAKSVRAQSKQGATIRQLLSSLMIFCLACTSLASTDMISEDDLLILDLTVDKTVLTNNLVGYGQADHVYLSLYDIADAFEFPLDISLQNNQATVTGWFIHESRTFFLDTATNIARIAGQESNYDPNQVIVQDNDLLVDNRLLSTWFPVDLSLQFSTLTIKAHPREELPFQKRLARYNRSVTTLSEAEPAKLPLKETPYQFLSSPNLKFTLNYNSYRENEDDDADINLTYSLISSGEIAYMSSSLFLNGTNENEIANARLNFWRSDAEGDLFGPFGLTQFSLGDTTPPYLPFLTRPVERGIKFTNRDLFRSSIFDTVDFEGDLLNDWEVELYRNNILIGVERDAPSGRYVFKDVPLTFGKNTIKLVFYGPNGQERQEVKTYRIGPGMSEPGVFAYSASITEQGKTLIETDEQKATDSPDDPRIVSEFTYGLTRNLSLRGGLQLSTIEEEQVDYQSLDLTFSFSSLFGAVGASRDSMGENGYSVSLSAPVGKFGIRASHIKNTGLLTLDEEDKDRLITEKSELSLLGPAGKVSTATSISRQKSAESEDLIASNSLSGHVGKLSWNHSLRYQLTEYNDGRDEELTTGSLRLGSRWGPLRFRTGLRYGIAPENELTNGYLDTTIKLRKNLSANFRVDHALGQNGNDDLTKYVSGFNWQLKQLVFTPTLSYDSEERYRGFIFLTTDLSENSEGKLAFNKRSRGHSGTVRVYVFWDKNANGEWDNDDEPIKGAEVIAVQGNHRAKSNAEGIAFIEYMTADLRTDIQITPNTWEDPSLSPANAGYSVIPHPGVVTELYLPFVKTGEIDGTFYINENGAVREFSNVKLNLVNTQTGQIVATEKTAYDGYYLFEQVPSGQYQVQIDNNASLKPLRLPPSVTIGQRGGVHNGLDIVSVSTRPTPPVAKLTSSNTRQEQIKTLRLSDSLKPPAPSTSVASTPKVKPVSALSLKPVAQSTGSKTNNRPAVKRKSGQYYVQLAAFRTQKSAESYITATQWMTFSGLFGGRELSIIKADLGAQKGIYHRVVVESMSKQEAADLCRELKQIGQGCMVNASQAD